VIKFIVDMRGLKRFKQKGDTMSSSDLGSDVKDMSNARDVFRRMNNTTQYAQQFGAKPIDLQDFKVLAKKPLSKLAMAQVLKPEIMTMMNRWLAMNDQEKFTERIFVTIREMYTLVKGMLHDVPTS